MVPIFFQSLATVYALVEATGPYDVQLPVTAYASVEGAVPFSGQALMMACAGQAVDLFSFLAQEMVCA